jgi:nicotinamidase-related amidase
MSKSMDNMNSVAAALGGDRSGRLQIEESNPTPYVYSPAKAALLVIDMQHDYCSEGGYASALGHDILAARAIIPAVQSVIDAARRQGLLVIYTREGHRPDLSDCPPVLLERTRRKGAEIGGQGPLGRRLIRGEPGHEIIPELEVRPNDLVIDKPEKSAFYGTDLEVILSTRDITHLVFSGVSTNVCVTSTLRDATDRAFWNLTLTDACAAYTKALHDAAIDMIASVGGVFGWTAMVKDFEHATEG